MAVEDPQDSEEQVDDVEVQADSSGNLLLNMVVTHDHLGINQDIRTEQQSRNTTIDELTSGAVREEHGHEAEENQTPKGAEKVGHPGSEIVLGLAGESRKEDKNAGCEEDGVEHDGGLVEGDDDGDGVGFGEGEEGEEEEVGRVGFALPVGETHEDHGAEELGGC